MKYILFIILIIPLLLLTSCHREGDYTAIRRLVNETQYPVNIRVFGDDVEFKYQIDPYDTVDIQGKCYTSFEEYCALGWTSWLGKAEIIFDDKVILENRDSPSSCKDRAINADPSGGCFGYVRSNENGIIVYTYRITEEDYESAEPINGN